MQKILIICGPTATGKTELAFKLANEFKGELVSADSRQIYKSLDALTGKDLPKKVKRQISKVKSKYRDKTYQLGFYEINGVRLWMYDVVSVRWEFSVAHYQTLAKTIIKDIENRNKLPILVGGTGLYLKSLTENLTDISIPPDSELRKRLESRTLGQLQEELVKLNPAKWHTLNESDRKNPRRLTRAIEISFWEQKNPKKIIYKPLVSDILWIGLRAQNNIIKNKISEKVYKRWAEAVREVQSIKNYVNILGVLPIREYLGGKSTKEEALENWISAEFKYAKRQMTWFKKQAEINWFHINDAQYIEKIKRSVNKWYTK